MSRWTTAHRAVEAAWLLLAAVILVVALLSGWGCWPPGLGVEVGGADVYKDRFRKSADHGLRYERRPDGTEVFEVHRDDGLKQEGQGAGVRGRVAGGRAVKKSLKICTFECVRICNRRQISGLLDPDTPNLLPVRRGNFPSLHRDEPGKDLDAPLVGALTNVTRHGVAPYGVVMTALRAAGFAPAREAPAASNAAAFADFATPATRHADRHNPLATGCARSARFWLDMVGDALLT